MDDLKVTIKLKINQIYSTKEIKFVCKIKIKKKNINKNINTSL